MKQYTIFIVLSFLLFDSAILTAQSLTGIKTIDVTTGDYTTLSDAVTALNTNGVGAGGVTFLVTDGQTFSSGPLSITATGTSSDPITFKQSGTGTKPIINFTGTGTASEAGFKLNASDYITFDGLDLRDVGTAMEYGIYLVGLASDGCRNNTVKNCVIDLYKTTSSHFGIHVQSAATSDAGKNSNNKFYNNTVKDCYRGYYFSGTTSYPDDGNEISVQSGGTSTIENIACEGVRINHQTNIVVSNTSFIDFAGGSNTLYGIYSYSGNNNSLTAANNTFSNFTSSGSITGISFSSGTTLLCYGNTISGFSSSGNNVLPVSLGAGAPANVYNNIITGIEYTGTSTRTAYGLYINGGITVNIYNNMISGISAPASTHATAGACGIYLGGGQAVNLFNNSVLLNYTSTAAGNVSAALSIDVNSPTTVLHTNNIFVNNVDVTTGTRAVAFRKGSSSGTSYITNLSVESDNNLYYAGTPGSKNLIFYDAVQICQTLAEYKTFVASRTIDINAITENVPFVSSVVPYDLHINPAIETLLESAGIPVSSPIAVTTDIDGNTRNGTTPDIGADEGDFLSLDVVQPAISYTPLSNTTGTSNRTFSGVSITDHSGINTADGTKPRVYFKRKNDANEYNDNTGSTNGWKWVEANGAASPFEFTVNYSLLNGGTGVSTGDVIQYFVIAQDNYSTPRVGINSGTFNASPVSVALTSAAFPLTGTIRSYSISFSGNITIGAGEKYTSLTGSGGLFEAISAGSFAANVVVLVSSDLTEDGAVALSQWTDEDAGAYTLTISPNSATLRSITGSSGTGLIKITGCSRVTFDGRYSGSGRYLSIRNTNTSGSVIGLSENSSNNVIQNLIVESSSTSSSNGAIHFGSGTNINTSILDCEIRDRSDVSAAPKYGIYVNSAGTMQIQILNNSLHDFHSAAMIFDGGCRNILIEGNEIFMVNPSSLEATCGIRINNCNLVDIYRNKIYGIDGSFSVSGIYYAGSSGVISARILNNMVTLSPVTGTSIRGILYAGGSNNTLTINHNSVYIGGTDTSSSNNSFAFEKYSDVSVLTVYNNIFVNGRINDGGTGDHYAIGFQSITGTDNIDFNNYYSAALNGFFGSWTNYAVTDIDDWIFYSGFSMDENSVFADPVFVSASDLHLNTTVTPYFLAGTPTTVTTDYDGETRDDTYPYMGCDEDPGKALPVELTSFTSIVKGKNVELKWNTATEVNNAGFEVERSSIQNTEVRSQNTAKAWQKVGFVEGAGTTSAPKSYSFVDATASGKVAYRLKQIDRDGKFEYSQEV
ncbi:MAG TPA: hypothetical protein DCQ28_05690, partial [Bacteroidetes bacterium]|nr:hypothetical protein [Bacteroidota bacterium]